MVEKSSGDFAWFLPFHFESNGLTRQGLDKNLHGNCQKKEG
jgi:hypothetical protein